MNLNKLLSILVVIFYMGFLFIKNAGLLISIGGPLCFSIYPLYIIWNYEDYSKWQGNIRFHSLMPGPQINEESPPRLTLTLGWTILLFPIFIPLLNYLIN